MKQSNQEASCVQFSFLKNGREKAIKFGRQVYGLTFCKPDCNQVHQIVLFTFTMYTFAAIKWVQKISYVFKSTLYKPIIAITWYGMVWYGLVLYTLLTQILIIINIEGQVLSGQAKKLHCIEQECGPYVPKDRHGHAMSTSVSKFLIVQPSSEDECENKAPYLRRPLNKRISFKSIPTAPRCN